MTSELGLLMFACVVIPLLVYADRIGVNPFDLSEEEPEDADHVGELLRGDLEALQDGAQVERIREQWTFCGAHTHQSASGATSEQE